MHLHKTRLFTVAALSLAFGLAASNASAQQATFTLAFPVHVGNLTLQPGDYRMTVPSATSSIRAIFLYGDGKVQATLPLAMDTQELTDHSYLELVNVRGTYFVHKYTSGVTGRAYTFGIPKAARREILANARATSIPVTGGAAN